jgi:hypothetical protein
MDYAHEVDIHHSPKQRRIGFSERRGFRDARIRDQDIDWLAARGFRNCGSHSGLIGDIGYGCEMRFASGNSVVQGSAIAAEHGNRRSSVRKRGCDGAADAPSAPGDERMRGTRQSGHAQPLSNELTNAKLAYILDLKLLQEISFQRSSEVSHA